MCPFNELLSYAKPTDAVYDIGCGSGQFAALIANFTDVKTIKGIEVDEHLVRNAAQLNKRFEKDKNISFSYFSGSEIPADIRNYDLIYMVDVYHHIPKNIRENFMKQIYDQMKPGARLMLKDIDGGSPFIPFNKLHDLIFAQELSREISFASALQLLTSLGFKITEARKKNILVYPHYFILAEK